MGTWNAFYVQSAGSTAVTLARIKSMFPDHEVEASQSFLGVKMQNDFDVPHDSLSELSRTLHTDVFWLGFQSAVDAFQYYHWKDGKRLRALVYGCFEQERTWEVVEGQNELWEKDVFFDDDVLAYAKQSATTEEEKRELDKIWRTYDLRVGQIQPSLDARDCAFNIAAFYGFPHYE